MRSLQIIGQLVHSALSNLVVHSSKYYWLGYLSRLVLDILFGDLRFEDLLAGRLLILVLATFLLYKGRGSVLDKGLDCLLDSIGGVGRQGAVFDGALRRNGTCVTLLVVLSIMLLIE